jgi:hypothetical protein
VLDKPSVVIAGLLFRTLERVGRQVELLRRAQPMRRRARITIRRLSPAICVVAGLAPSFPAYDPGNGIKSLQLLRARVSVERFPSHGARAALACPATPVAPIQGARPRPCPMTFMYEERADPLNGYLPLGRSDGRGLRDRLLSPLRVISFPVRPPGFASLSFAASTGDPQIGGEGDGVSDSRDYAAMATPVMSARERTPTVATHQNNTSRVRGGPPGPRQSGPRACEQIACFGFLHRSTCPWIPRRFLRSDATVIGKVPQPLATYRRQRGRQWLITLTRASPSP